MNIVINGFKFKPAVTAVLTTRIPDKRVPRLSIALTFSYQGEEYHHPLGLSISAEELVRHCAPALIVAARKGHRQHDVITAHLNAIGTAVLENRDGTITVIATLQARMALSSLPLTMLAPFIQAS